MATKHKVMVGLSGGVDSAVTAYLLKQQGHWVEGIYMQNWEPDNNDPYCSAEQDLSDARAVCDHLNIPFHQVNFSKQYWDRVFSHCLDEFNALRTPNPDVLCNREIKFKVLLEHALSLGADYLATGHYARIINNQGVFELHKAIDSNKDQTYFLYLLNQYQLQHALFPLADIPKPKLRDIAADIGLPNCDKKDSTGICFIGERHFKTFLSEYLLGQPGDIISDTGTIIGRHDGLMYYTIGQRRGINIGGQRDADELPWYVLSKDLENNQLVVGQGHDHPKLFARQVTCDQVHWISGHQPTLPFACNIKMRHRQQEQGCRITSLNHDTIAVELTPKQRAATPGQAVVFYQGEQCLGGATIITAQA